MFEERITSYLNDRELLASLGLKPFTVNHNEKTFVGRVDYPDGSYVMIWVTAISALYFEFEIVSIDGGRRYKVETGTGSLSTFWPMADAMAKDMWSVVEKSEIVMYEKGGEV